LRRLAPAFILCTAIAPPMARADDDIVPLPRVEVVGATPLPGLGTPLFQVPSNVQTFGAGELGRQRTGGVAEFLNLNANSVSLNSPTGNAFQPDVSFRGFTASALLGTPQGLSVFQDGVRINEAFADVVNWDLLPKNAVASMQLLPGSNPVFGLNTLGGALTIDMKDGFTFPGATAAISAGSFGRTEVSADGGMSDDRLAAYAAFEAIDDDGWREHSSTRIRRLYARADAHTARDAFSIAATVADNHLEGTQALPVSMLVNPRQAYTWPDTTDTRLGFVNGTWQHTIEAAALVAANAYFRHMHAGGTNSNVNGEYAPPSEPFEAFNLASTGTTRSWGASVQANLKSTWAALSHQVAVGVAYDAGTTDFAQSAQPAMFANDRETVGIGPFATETSITATNRSIGAYVSDTMTLSGGWSVILSGRYNAAKTTTKDRTGESPAIDATNTFRRFNPAAGVTWSATERFNAFGGVSQGMRVPTPVELTCADPNAPCILPNIFVADPPLQPVRATTYEAGIRGSVGATGFYRAALYRTELADDIQFVSAGGGAVNAGYFRNVGNTRRQGLELSAGAVFGSLHLTGRYSLLQATYRTAFTESSPNNITADAIGNIEVGPGDRIPGLPRETVRLRADWTNGPYAIGATLLAASSQYARGNENNADPGGKVPGYALVALDASWQISREWQLFARIDNLLNRTYQNFGILGANYFRGPGNTFDTALAGPEPFRSPGAAIGAWLGIQYRLDRGSANR